MTPPRELDHLPRHGTLVSYVRRPAVVCVGFATRSHQDFSWQPSPRVLTQPVIRIHLVRVYARAPTPSRRDEIPTRIFLGGRSRVSSGSSLGGAETCMGPYAARRRPQSKSTDTCRQARTNLSNRRGSAENGSASAIWRASLSLKKQMLGSHTSPDTTRERAGVG